MKKKVLALAGCIAATAPTISIADVLPKNLFGLNLGEINSSSFLNQPFKGVIPFLFTSVENSKNLSVKLAPEFIFEKVGAEKHPILNNLNFQITQQDSKPVILISSDLPIRLPFLNFILEIQGPEGSVYQDYTVLLDPKSKQDSNPTAENISVNRFDMSGADETFESALSSEELLRANGTLLLANLSSRTLPSTTLSSNRQVPKYRVKAGDSLSKIAKKQLDNTTSLSSMSRLIYQKNPSAFIRGDINKIKKGAILNLPTASEVNGFELARNNAKSKSITISTSNSAKQQSKISSEKDLSKSSVETKYTVAKGDSLSKITQKFITDGMSFTKVMNAIYTNNPEAFVNRSKNKIKAGAELTIPSIAQFEVETIQNKIAEENNFEQEFVIKKTVENNDLEPALAKKEVAASDSKSDKYQVKKGDNLSIITKKIGYEGIPFATMLKAIYVHNPDAFAEGNITQLSEGAVITLPPLESLTSKNDVAKATDEAKSNTKQLASSLNKTADSSNLIKRIRELRKELKQSKDNLSEMKERLSDKEILLQQKNIQLESLNTAIMNSNRNVAPELVAVSAVKTIVTNQTSAQDSYKPISKAEMAKLRRDNLENKKKTLQEIENSEVLSEKPEIQEVVVQQSYKTSLDAMESEVSSLIAEFTNKNYAYLTLSLLLGLLLIRYRRELYSYTYSAIKYDQPKYYPVPEADKYELKETNINFHDPKMDEDSYIDDELMPNMTNQVIDEKPKIVINPLLVEAKEEIFESGFEGKEEAKQIEHCEHLVTELFDDLDTDEDITSSSEWTNIEKVCDNYIDKIKDAEGDLTPNEDGLLVNGVTDFNHMMTDLLESLDKVDKSVKKYNILDEDFPEIVRRTEEKVTDEQKLS